MKTRDSLGFTLIEVLIALAILSTISILVARTISQGVKAKAKIQEQIDSVSRLRDAIRVIEKDVNQAFHYRDIEREINALIKKKKVTPGVPVAPEPPVAAPEATRVDPETHFIGLDSQMDFVTMNTGQVFQDNTQADFIEVGYRLSDCRSIKGGKSSGKCLWRRVSSLVDTDVTKGGKEVVLLDNVQEFKLAYFGKGKQDWNSTWKSDIGGDAVTKGAFPELVEVSLAIQDEENGSKKKKYSMRFVIPVHFPNNPTEEDKKNATSSSPVSVPGLPTQ